MSGNSIIISVDKLGIAVQCGSSGLGHPFVDFEMRVVLKYTEFILRQNS